MKREHERGGGEGEYGNIATRKGTGIQWSKAFQGCNTCDDTWVLIIFVTCFSFGEMK
jgi:hypothetical protein